MAELRLYPIFSKGKQKAKLKKVRIYTRPWGENPHRTNLLERNW